MKIILNKYAKMLMKCNEMAMSQWQQYGVINESWRSA